MVYTNVVMMFKKENTGCSPAWWHPLSCLLQRRELTRDQRTEWTALWDQCTTQSIAAVGPFLWNTALLPRGPVPRSQYALAAELARRLTVATGGEEENNDRIRRSHVPALRRVLFFLSGLRHCRGLGDSSHPMALFAARHQVVVVDDGAGVVDDISAASSS